MAVDAASQELVLRLVEARDALLRSFSQILLSRSRWVGVLLFAAAAVVPMNALYGVCAVLMVLVLARWWNLAPSQLESGLLGYNSLLVGIGGAALLEPSPVSFAVVMLAAGLTLPITAAMKSALSVFDLPVLTLPFIVVFFLLLGVAPLLEIPLVPLHVEPWSRASFFPEEIAIALKSLGALFFVPRVEAGLLVLAALLLSSRIATLASVVAFVFLVLAANRFTVMTSESLRMSLGYNAVLVAVALSGIWFVPSRSSFVLALVGVALSTLFALGLLPILARLELPLLILPFNLSLLVMLTAMRQRLRDQTPKAVDFAAGSPEQNLNTFNTRLARTQSLYGIRFRLPFLGKWRCTQSNDGEHTHQGEWRRPRLRGRGAQRPDLLRRRDRSQRLPLLQAPCARRRRRHGGQRRRPHPRQPCWPRQPRAELGKFGPHRTRHRIVLHGRPPLAGQHQGHRGAARESRSGAGFLRQLRPFTGTARPFPAARLRPSRRAHPAGGLRRRHSSRRRRRRAGRDPAAEVGRRAAQPRDRRRVGPSVRVEARRHLGLRGARRRGGLARRGASRDRPLWFPDVAVAEVAYDAVLRENRRPLPSLRRGGHAKVGIVAAALGVGALPPGVGQPELDRPPAGRALDASVADAAHRFRQPVPRS